MKFVLLFNIIFAYDSDNGSISYLCNRCDLFDLETNIMFEKLVKPEFKGARPVPKLNATDINLNVTCNDEDIFNKYLDSKFPGLFSIVDRTTLIFAATSSIIGLINLIATLTLVVTERKISSSVRKTYMQTAILENE